MDNDEKRFVIIDERNKKVELDKAWETSWARRIVIAILTYFTIVLFFYVARLSKPLINSIVPTLGFVLSTLSLPFFKKIWIRHGTKNDNMKNKLWYKCIIGGLISILFLSGSYSYYRSVKDNEFKRLLETRKLESKKNTSKNNVDIKNKSLNKIIAESGVFNKNIYDSNQKNVTDVELARGKEFEIPNDYELALDSEYSNKNSSEIYKIKVLRQIDKPADYKYSDMQGKMPEKKLIVVFVKYNGTIVNLFVINKYSVLKGNLGWGDYDKDKIAEAVELKDLNKDGISEILIHAYKGYTADSEKGMITIYYDIKNNIFAAAEKSFWAPFKKSFRTIELNEKYYVIEATPGSGVCSLCPTPYLVRIYEFTSYNSFSDIGSVGLEKEYESGYDALEAAMPRIEKKILSGDVFNMYSSSFEDKDYPEARVMLFSIADNIRKDYKEVVLTDLFFDNKKEVINIGDDRIEVDRAGSPSDIDSSSTFSIFKNGELKSVNESLDIITKIYNLKANDIDYYLLKSWSGGMHCCFGLQSIVYKNKELRVGEALYIGNIENINYYFEKDGQLYFLISDDSFSYFHSSFAYSLFFPVFYRIDSESANFVGANDEFKEYYQQLTENLEESIKKIKPLLGNYIDFDGWGKEGQDVFSFLLANLTSKVLSGYDNELAKKEFVNDCNFFFKDGMIEGEKAEDVANEAVNKIDGLYNE